MRVTRILFLISTTMRCVGSENVVLLAIFAASNIINQIEWSKDRSGRSSIKILKDDTPGDAQLLFVMTAYDTWFEEFSQTIQALIESGCPTE